MLLGFYLVKAAFGGVVIELASLNQMWVLNLQNLRLEQSLVDFRVLVATRCFSR